MKGEQGGSQTVSALISWILILSGVKCILKLYHTWHAVSFIAHQNGRLGEKRVDASRAWQPDPELLCCSSVTTHLGSGVWASGKSCVSWHGFLGGGFVYFWAQGDCRAFACSGLGVFCACMFGFSVCFFFRQWVSHLGFSPSLQKVPLLQSPVKLCLRGGISSRRRSS